MKCFVPLATLLALLAAAPAGAAQAGPVTISFDAATMTRDQFAGRMSGSFAMTGRFSDAGTVTTSYRYAGPAVDGMVTLRGARGVFTIALRGSLGGVVGGLQHGGGRWRVCGGTGLYKRATGSGQWNSVADFGAAPPGMQLPDVHGALYGRMARGSTPRRPRNVGVSCSPVGRAPDFHRLPVY